MWCPATTNTSRMDRSCRTRRPRACAAGAGGTADGHAGSSGGTGTLHETRAPRCAGAAQEPTPVRGGNASPPL